MGALTINVTGRPAPKGSLRHVGRGRLVEQVAGSKPWRETVAVAAREAARTAGWAPPLGPVQVVASIYVPRLKRPRAWPITRSSGDLDKHMRNILDALVDAGVLRDDSQVVSIVANKGYANKPGAWLYVRDYDGEVRDGDAA